MRYPQFAYTIRALNGLPVSEIPKFHALQALPDFNFGARVPEFTDPLAERCATLGINIVFESVWLLHYPYDVALKRHRQAFIETAKRCEQALTFHSATLMC